MFKRLLEFGCGQESEEQRGYIMESAIFTAPSVNDYESNGPHGGCGIREKGAVNRPLRCGFKIYRNKN